MSFFNCLHHFERAMSVLGAYCTGSYYISITLQFSYGEWESRTPTVCKDVTVYLCVFYSSCIVGVQVSHCAPGCPSLSVYILCIMHSGSLGLPHHKSPPNHRLPPLHGNGRPRHPQHRGTASGLVMILPLQMGTLMSDVATDILMCANGNQDFYWCKNWSNQTLMCPGWENHDDTMSR
jgi:hypothetical protein